MSINGDGSSNSTTEGPRSTRGRRMGVRSLLVLVACCAAVFWALRHVWENSDPELVEARSAQRQAIAALRSGKPAQRLDAVRALERRRAGDGSDAIRPLVGALDDPAGEVRLAAVEALDAIAASLAKSRSGGWAVDEAARGLIRCANDPDPALRTAAIKAIGSIVGRAARSGTGGEAVRASATALRPCLKDPDPRVRLAAASALAAATAPGPGSPGTFAAEFEAARDVLTELAGDRDPGVRRATVAALVANSDRGGGPPGVLSEGLKDESAENRAAAAGHLMSYRRGLDPWVPLLLRLAEHDPDPSVRERCTVVLDNACAPPAITTAIVPDLIAGLKDRAPKIRSKAAWLLRTLRAGAGDSIPALLVVLNEPLAPGVAPVFGPYVTLDPGCAAASALGRIAPGAAEEKEVVAALTEVARGGPVTRRGWAAYALGELGPASVEAVPVLITMIEEATPKDSFERAASAAFALGKIAPETPSADRAVAAILPVLNSKDVDTRVQAIESIGRFGPKAAAALPRLRATLRMKEYEPRLKDAATRAVAAIENAGAP